MQINKYTGAGARRNTMRMRTVGLAAVTIVVVVLALAGARVFDTSSVSVWSADSDADSDYADSTTALRAAAIAFYEKRLGEDPISALDMAQLAALNLEEGRLSGSVEALERAELLARRSIFTRSVRNSRSSALLVSILLAQHRFSAAREVAAELVREEPEMIEYRAMLAEVQMELGNYESAGALLSSLHGDRRQLALAPRFARWVELNGAPEEAIRIAKQMRDETMGRFDLDASRALWFHLRVIDLELRYGHTVEASHAVRIAQRLTPNDWRLIAAAARVEMQLGNSKKAIALAQRAVAIVADPTTLALLADGYAALGDSAMTRSLEDALERSAKAQPGPLHRSWSLRLLDNNRRTREVLAAAIADTLERRDVYGYDLLAWALYKNGRTAEANEVAKKALRLGTSEPAFLYHAGVIAADAHDRTRAAALLQSSLKRKSVFTPLQRHTAQAALQAIRQRDSQ